MHLESVAETLQTGDRVAKSAHNLTTQERAGGSMCRQDLRIGSRTNRTLARAAFAAAVTLVGASLRRNSAANSSSPPCGEGLGVGVVRGGTALPQPPDPPPRPSPSRNRVYAGFGHSTKRSKSATADFDWGEGVTAARPQLDLATNASLCINRRTVLARSAALLALCAGTTGRGPNAAAQALVDLVAPVPMPPQAPAKEG